MHEELKELRSSQAVLQREIILQQGLEAQYAQRSALQVLIDCVITFHGYQCHFRHVDRAA